MPGPRTKMVQHPPPGPAPGPHQASAPHHNGAPKSVPTPRFGAQTGHSHQTCAINLACFLPRPNMHHNGAWHAFCRGDLPRLCPALVHAPYNGANRGTSLGQGRPAWPGGPDFGAPTHHDCPWHEFCCAPLWGGCPKRGHGMQCAYVILAHNVQCKLVLYIHTVLYAHTVPRQGRVLATTV
jgi:hypothetical protein